MARVLKFHRLGYLGLVTLHGVWGCGHVVHGPSGSGGTEAASGAAEAGAENRAGTGGAPAPPVVSCGTWSRDPKGPIVEICEADETCCDCGCAPANAACMETLPCVPPGGQSCGNETCRDGYICCNSICGVCAKSTEDCTAVAGRCEAVGMDPSFDRCSEILPMGGGGGGSLGSLETLLARFQGRWLLCSREAEASAGDEVSGFDITSDGRYFLLMRDGDRFVRR